MRLLLPILISIAAISGRAHAQSAEAEQLFTDGDRDMKLGRLEQACDAFEASNRIEARAGTLIRLGQCREELHQIASAWSAYKDALSRVKDPKKQKVAAARIAALEPKLSHFTVRIAEKTPGLEVTRDGKPIDAGEWGHALPINGGEYQIAAHAPGFKEWSQKVSVPTERGDITVTVPQLEAEPHADHQQDHAIKQKPPEPLPPAQPAGVMSTKRGIAVGVGVVAIGAVVGGALLGHSAQGQRDDAYALCPDPAVNCANATRANSLISSAHTRAIEADVLFGASAVAAIVATTLWVTGAPVEAQVTSDSVALAYVGRW